MKGYFKSGQWVCEREAAQTTAAGKRTSKHENGDLAVAENAQLHGFLHQACRMETHEIGHEVLGEWSSPVQSRNARKRGSAKRTDTTLVERHRARFQIIDTMN
jgi:hypothetical protein